MTQACDGIRVIDFTQGMAGAVATMLLCDNGAEVIKIEPPSGDPDRARPVFQQWHRGKKSVVLDLKTPEGRKAARDLAGGADVVLENFRPGKADVLGIGYQALAELNPRLVYASISGFGQKGPYRGVKGYDAVVAAKAGRMLWANPWRRRGPIFEAIPRMTHGAAHLAVQGILAALLARDKTGKGQWVQTSLLQSAMVHSLGGWLVPVGSEEVRARVLNAPPAPGTPHDTMPAGYLIVECQDGRWIQMASTTVHIFRNFVTLLGLESIYDDLRFRDMPYTFPSPEERAEFTNAVKAKMLEKTSQEWTDLFLKDGNIGGEVYETTEEFMSHPQTTANGMVVEVSDPRYGKMKQLGPLAAFTDTPSHIRGPAPGLGQHTREVLASLANGAPTSPRQQGSDRHIRRPLEGYTVLELASYYAAPFGVTLLAEMGARVIKIEPPSGDLMRRIPEVFPKTCQGKESIAIDLKTEAGRNVFHQLVAKADALMHNFRPGSWERIGLDYETIHRVNPRINYLYAGSYGSTGPYARQPAFHPTVSAITGSGIRMSGEGNPPMDSAQGDPDASFGVATAMLLGLHAQRRIGKGQYMESRMITTGAYDVSDRFLAYEGMPPEQLPDSGQHGTSALYRLYPAGDGWVFICCVQDGEWRGFCRVLRREDLLEDPKFSTAEARTANDDALIVVIEQELRAKAAEEWERLFLQQDVPCVKADGTKWGAFFHTDPSIEENGFRAMTSHSQFGGDYYRHGPTVLFSDLETVTGPPASIGQHSVALLKELGLTGDAIDALLADKVVVDQGPWAP